MRDGSPGSSWTRGRPTRMRGAIRFRCRTRARTAWDDAVRGRSSSPTSSSRPVLVRSDGRPTYNLRQSGRRHARRDHPRDPRRDHVSNTPKQIQILRALGAEPPVYAHVPDVLGTDGKNSPSATARSRSRLPRRGLHPGGARRFTARLGWAYGNQTEVFSREDLVRLFSLDRVSSSPAVFDYEKLAWLNGVHLRNLPLERTRPRVVPPGTGDRLGRGAGAAGGAARLGEDRDPLAVPRLRSLPVRGNRAGSGASTPRPGGGGDTVGARAVRRGGDQAACADRPTPRAAARGVSADSSCGHRVRVSPDFRELRAARSRRRASRLSAASPPTSPDS